MLCLNTAHEPLTFHQCLALAIGSVRLPPTSSTQMFTWFL